MNFFVYITLICIYFNNCKLCIFSFPPESTMSSASTHFYIQNDRISIHKLGTKLIHLYSLKSESNDLSACTTAATLNGCVRQHVNRATKRMCPPVRQPRHYKHQFADCGLMQPAIRTHNPQLHTIPTTWKPKHQIWQATTTCIILSSSWWWA